ncbi:hypothetical protein DASC09_010570 [Saccharomycopsis crataegensis]|uniref:Uncharacterized protein n=1 Tax=Saccharomycopsis crataegensis TaxID=43959 RepID=A0AAV5QG37_9ASCO|nr:hypothetical protein DASC09_010570 [Saccharomycopsis crataegensis]
MHQNSNVILDRSGVLEKVLNDAKRRKIASEREKEKELSVAYRNDGANRPAFKFSLDSYSSRFAVLHFRFTKAEIYYLLDILKIDSGFVKEFKVRTSPLNALLCLLSRFAVPYRLADISVLLGLSPEVICSSVIKLCNYIYRKYWYLLKIGCYTMPKSRIDDLQSLSGQNYHPTLIGFIDATTVDICEPNEND